MEFCRNEPLTYWEWEDPHLFRIDTIILYHTVSSHLHHQKYHYEHGCPYLHHHSHLQQKVQISLCGFQ